MDYRSRDYTVDTHISCLCVQYTLCTKQVNYSAKDTLRGCRMCIKFDTILSNVISVRTSKSWFVFVIMKYSMYIICCLWLGCVELCPPMFLCPGAVSYDRTMKHGQWFSVSIDIRFLAHIIPWPWCYDVFTQCSPLYM